MSEPLATWRVRARNIATASENRIHDDSVARDYGFSGGLVPGIVVYGYLVRPVVERLGLDWLARGSASVRFRSPIYDGEEVLVVATPGEAGVIALEARGPDGECRATGAATPATEPGTNHFPSDVPETPRRPERPPASAESLRPGTVLGTLRVPIDERALGFPESIGDDLALYRGAGAAAHPGFLLTLANEALARNVVLGPWIHAASEVSHHSVARAGDEISVRASVAERFEQKGHEIAVLDVLLLADGDRPVQRIRHTAIYRPRRRS